MDDFDNLNSKTDSDLRQIAVAFGDFTAEEAEKKTRDELLMAITGAKDIGDITTVDLTEEPVPVKENGPAPGSAGQIKLYTTDPKDAAMIMAIVADSLGKPLNELRFISIREVKG